MPLRRFGESGSWLWSSSQHVLNLLLHALRRGEGPVCLVPAILCGSQNVGDHFLHGHHSLWYVLHLHQALLCLFHALLEDDRIRFRELLSSVVHVVGKGSDGVPTVFDQTLALHQLPRMLGQCVPDFSSNSDSSRFVP